MSKKEGNIVVNYFSDSVLELKKVTWPTRIQAFRMTVIVLGFCLAAAILIGVADLLFNQGFQILLNLSRAA